MTNTDNAEESWEMLNAEHQDLLEEAESIARKAVGYQRLSKYDQRELVRTIALSLLQYKKKAKEANKNET